MKKKFLIAMMMAIISVSILACRSKTSDLPADTEVAKELTTPEKISEELPDSNVESVDSIEETANIEDTEQKEYTPTWYMDSEGIKSDELGVVIRKDKVDLEMLGFSVNYGICTSSGNSKLFEQQAFICHYYEGDLDSYIAESSGIEGVSIEKHEVDGVSFAYKEGGGWFEGQKTVVFAGNGIIVYADFYDLSENIDDYFSRMVSISDESRNGMGTMFYMVDTQNAQEVVDKYVEASLEPDENRTIEYSAIDGTVEINLGKYKYLGRGLIGQYKGSDNEQENWLFYSDETTWSVSFSGEEGDRYEDYISIIENLNESE